MDFKNKFAFLSSIRFWKIVIGVALETLAFYGLFPLELAHSLATILGTGSDNAPGIWNDIRLQILNKDTTRYWKKDSGWDPGVQWLDASDTNPA